MGMFYQEQDSKYEIMGSWNWKIDSRNTLKGRVSGIFQEKLPDGSIHQIELEANDESLFFRQGALVKCLDLCLTVIEEHFYLWEHKRVYEIKLKRKNSLTKFFTNNIDTFITFFCFLAKYCILTSFEKHFKIGKLLGKGTFGKVFDGLNIFSKDNVALKIFEKSKMNSREDAELTITNEIINLERLRKYHLSPLIQVYETSDCIILVLHKAEAGNMVDYIKKVNLKDYNGDLIQIIMKKILLNLKELHSAGYIHRDIKPENILFNSTSLKSSLFLGDFGVTVQKKQCQFNLMGRKCSGTMGFIAPEVVHENKYDEKCDMFSLGCLFYFLFKGQSLFSGKSLQETHKSIGDSRVIASKLNTLDLTENAEDLMRKLLKTNPSERISAQAALQHDYFDNTQNYKVWADEDDTTLLTYINQRIAKFYK